MGLWDKIRGEFVDIIEWLDDSRDTLVWRFPRHGNEIKYGANLIVRESQVAVFVDQGQVADVFQPGRHVLETENIPILSTLKGWKHGFESPFKAEVYFVNTRRFPDLKWGTKNPVMLRDEEFGPVRLRAFGTYAIRVQDPLKLIQEIAGTDGRFQAGEITDQLRNLIVSRLADILGESKIPVLDLAANYDELGEFCSSRISPEFANYGLEVTKLLVENISLPPEVEEALDKRTSMGVIGNLQAYTQFQAAESMEAAAENPGGLAGGGLGMGMGFAMASQMGQAMGNASGRERPGRSPSLPGAVNYHVAIDGKQAGPFPLETLSSHIASGQVTRESLVWKAGMAAWAAASTVPELASLFDRQPPPLPPQA